MCGNTAIVDLKDHTPKKPRPKLGGGKSLEPEKTWKKQEKRVAELTGGELVPGSGAGSKNKGDSKNKDFLFENKSTDKKSLRLERSWLVKITKEAAGEMREPALTIAFGEMPVGTERDWVMIPITLFKDLTGC